MGTIFSILAAVVIFAGILLLGTPPARLGKLQQLKVAPPAPPTVAVEPQVRPEIYTPPPLRRETAKTEESNLTSDGVIFYTNAARQKDNLPPLASNSALTEAAKLRLEDMFAGQYFAHYSPEGKGASQAAEAAGYEYLAIGENLAWGNFDGDAGVVDAWLQSPGHRANILNRGYTEIGVAVKRGLLEGKSAWLAVQIFGLPRSVCPAPEATLKTRLAALENQVAEKRKIIESLRTELENQRPQGREEIREYNRKVDEYNLLVEDYNRIVQLMKSAVERYNLEVENFNSCLARWR
jgi:uncharacterized protein YkwD